MTENLQPDPKRAIAFLSWLTQGAPLHLERMNSVGVRWNRWPREYLNW